MFQHNKLIINRALSLNFFTFIAVDWTLVSDCYLTSCSETLKGSLQRFFISLSVQKFFMVRKLTKLLHISDLVSYFYFIKFLSAAFLFLGCLSSSIIMLVIIVFCVLFITAVDNKNFQ